MEMYLEPRIMNDNRVIAVIVRQYHCVFIEFPTHERLFIDHLRLTYCHMEQYSSILDDTR